MKTWHLAVGLAAIVGALGVYAYREKRRRQVAEAAAIAGFGQATGLSLVPGLGGYFAGGMT